MCLVRLPFGTPNCNQQISLFFGALAAIRNPAQQVAPMDDGFLN